MDRICEACGTPLPAGSRKDKRFCKPTCQAQAYDKTHPEQAANRDKRWREKHPEQWQEANQKNYEKRRDAGKLATMPSKSPEKQREYSRNYYWRKKRGNGQKDAQ